MYCPCDPKCLYKDCCQPYHEGGRVPTAEKLMRSRYSAFVFKLEDYLLKTWHPSKRPKKLNLDQDECKWLGLEIVSKAKGEESDYDGVVEFVARFEQDGQEYKLHERSKFIKRSGNWLYQAGTQIH